MSASHGPSTGAITNQSHMPQGTWDSLLERRSPQIRLIAIHTNPRVKVVD